MKILNITIERQDGSASSKTKLANFSQGFNVLPRSKGVEKSNIIYVMSMISGLSNGTKQHETLHKLGSKNSTKLLVSVTFSNPEELTIRWEIEAGKEDEYFLDDKAVDLVELENLFQQCHISYIREEHILEVMRLTPKKRALYFRDVLREAPLGSLVDSESTTPKQLEKEAEEIQKVYQKVSDRVKELESELTTYKGWEKQIQILENTHYAHVYEEAREAFDSLSGAIASMAPQVELNQESLKQIMMKLKKNSDALGEIRPRIRLELDKMKELEKTKTEYVDKFQSLKEEVLLLEGELRRKRESLNEAEDQHTLLHGEISVLNNCIMDLEAKITTKKAVIKDIDESKSRWDSVFTKKLRADQADFMIRCLDRKHDVEGILLDEEGRQAKKMRMQDCIRSDSENVKLLKLEQDLMNTRTQLIAKREILLNFEHNIKTIVGGIKQTESAVDKMNMEITKLEKGCHQLKTKIDMTREKINYMQQEQLLPIYERAYDEKQFLEYENLLKEEGAMKAKFGVLTEKVKMAENTKNTLEKEYTWITSRPSTSSPSIIREGDPKTALMESKSLRQQGLYMGKKVNTNVIKELELAKADASVLKSKHDKLRKQLLDVKLMMKERFANLQKNFSEISMGLLPSCRLYVHGNVFEESAELDVVEATAGSASVLSCCDKQSQIFSLALIAAGVLNDEATICFIDEIEANFEKKELTWIKEQLALKFPRVQFIVKPGKRSALSNTVTYSQKDTPLL